MSDPNINPDEPGKLDCSTMPFWLQSTWPQYRKIVNGEERLLDGTETAETVIVKYDQSDHYKAFRDAVLKASEIKP